MATIRKVYGTLSKMQCSESICLRFIFDWFPKYRIGVIGGHSPWVFTFFRLIPMANPYQAAADICAEYVNRRVQQGSTTKDLYYYLVREVVSPCHLLAATDKQFSMRLML